MNHNKTSALVPLSALPRDTTVVLGDSSIDANIEDGMVVEFLIQPTGRKALTIVPMRVRRDKNSPNSVNTVTRTIDASLDHISFDELCTHLESNSKNIHHG